MKQYLDLVQDILDYGEYREDRTGTGTVSLFGKQLRFDLQQGFPLLTTKKMFFRGIVEELLWFIDGKCDIKELNQKGVHIWDEWMNDPGKVPYSNWRRWGENGFDQLGKVIEEIKTNPTSRRLLVNSWNPEEVFTPGSLVLPPCHFSYQFYVRRDRYLDLLLNMRSNDIFLGMPFNIASYALLCMMVAKVCKLIPGELIYTIGDAHIYSNHINQAKLQVTREPRELPMLEIKDRDKIEDFITSDFVLSGYDPWPKIKGELSK